MFDFYRSKNKSLEDRVFALERQVEHQDAWICAMMESMPEEQLREALQKQNDKWREEFMKLKPQLPFGVF